MIVEWEYVVIVMCVLLLCFLLWKEVNRFNRSRLVWRIVAAVLAVTGLACITLPFSINTKKIGRSNEVILLTEGFNTDSVQAFINNAATYPGVYVTDPAIIKPSNAYSATLISYHEIEKLSPDRLSAIHIFGYGLKAHQLKQLKDLPVIFHPSEIPPGITSIHWNRKLITGERLRVQGQYQNSSSKAISLILSGLSTTLDSLVIPPYSYKNFELSAKPKQLDRAVFRIVALQQRDTIEVEDVPVEVTRPLTLRVLMLASSPGFENKFLKNWLSQNGFAVVYRSRISKGKFQKEYVNTPATTLSSITASVIEKFDVLIADANELANISKTERSIIQSQISNKGLGLIIKADSSLNPSLFYAQHFAIIQGTENAAKVISLHLKDSSSVTPKLTIDHSVNIRPRTVTQLLIKNEKSDIYAANTIYGNGKIIVTTLNNTYTLMLSGNRESYNAVWSLLLNKAVKKQESSESISINPALPIINEPVQLFINSNNAGIKPALIGESNVYLQQNPLLPFLYTGTFWPAETGWLPQVDIEGKINWIYVYRKNDWKTLYAFQKLSNTKSYALNNYPKHIKNNEIVETVPVSISKVYFFLIFIISCGFLWFEKKLP